MTGKLVVEAGPSGPAATTTSPPSTGPPAQCYSCSTHCYPMLHCSPTLPNANCCYQLLHSWPLLPATATHQRYTNATAGPAGKPLTILAGASVQGSPNFDPDTITVKKGDKITVTNKDTLPHTVTSGTGPT